VLIVMRLRKVKGASETIAAHPEIVIPNGEELKGNWQSVFEKEQPIYIEVGMGKGQFMIGMAKQNPHLNFIGIEKFDSVMVRALEKVLEAGELPNLKLLKIDAEDLTDIFAENEVEGVYLNFSDPWPKPRHAKRRLTHENFLTRYEQITVPNGYLRFKTDNRLLFEYSLVSVTGYGMKLEDVALDLHQREALDWNIMTEYEEKFSAKGQPIYRLEAQFQSKKLA
jgi:tRNA (guanine-N7-)-methyltransferase